MKRWFILSPLGIFSAIAWGAGLGYFHHRVIGCIAVSLVIGGWSIWLDRDRIQSVHHNMWSKEPFERLGLLSSLAVGVAPLLVASVFVAFALLMAAYWAVSFLHPVSN